MHRRDHHYSNKSSRVEKKSRKKKNISITYNVCVVDCVFFFYFNYYSKYEWFSATRVKCYTSCLSSSIVSSFANG